MMIVPSNVSRERLNNPTMPSQSLNAASINSLSARNRHEWLSALSQETATKLFNRWCFWLRNDQKEPPGPWRIWLFLGGRGAGKTLAGAHFISDGILKDKMHRVGVIGATHHDVRAVMVEGESGLLKLSETATFEPSNRRITWPSGAIATVLSADEPDSLRGHQFDAIWIDGDRAPRKSSR